MNTPDELGFHRELQGSQIDTAWFSPRGEPRYLLNWRVSLVYQDAGKRQTFRGRVFDLSRTGFSLLSDHNLPVSDQVTVLISVPPMAAGQRPRILEVKSRVLYTVLSSEFQQFRVGVRFLDFKADGRRYLDANLATRVPAPVSTRRSE
ncbi:PilZ domain-containing protein [Jeongeupia naejangsanensis]|uniref:PilZ domain-containing protein n=1 Tax=Jeongeupia naejangsanensis TaxID=613195 RepID=A0ABS2BMV7_9NEIS|nr:PilZ domain-containing protein [Jeongeupia naejangsanensis]MBM3116893.1 PilZ domain-containing protein [Jeongeupia naejangsanensis]